MRSAISKFRSILAFGLVLWCAGAGCILMSYAQGAAMSSVDSSSAHRANSWGSIAASAGSHSCCKAHHSSSKRPDRFAGAPTDSTSRPSASFEQIAIPEFPAPSGATSCCPLTSGSFVTASRVQSNDSNLLDTARSVSIPLMLNDSESTPRDHNLHLPNLNQTYLRVCVFLI